MCITVLCHDFSGKQEESVNIGILYYSETGNTEKIARAIHGDFPEARCLPLEDFDEDMPGGSDFWFIGMPVHGNNFPDTVKAFFSRTDLSGLDTAVFFTHTGLMDDDTVRIFLDNLREKADETGMNLRGVWHCRGENSREDIVRWLKINMPDRYPHVLTAKGLPGDREISEARTWAGEVAGRLRKDG
jgi:flavodoxin